MIRIYYTPSGNKSCAALGFCVRQIPSPSHDEITSSAVIRNPKNAL
jgi:hypothetical protein